MDHNVPGNTGQGPAVSDYTSHSLHIQPNSMTTASHSLTGLSLSYLFTTNHFTSSIKMKSFYLFRNYFLQQYFCFFLLCALQIIIIYDLLHFNSVDINCKFRTSTNSDKLSHHSFHCLLQHIVLDLRVLSNDSLTGCEYVAYRVWRCRWPYNGLPHCPTNRPAAHRPHTSSSPARHWQ